MPRDFRIITNQIHNVYIADGFADDCEELIHRCSLVPILTFQSFCDIWKDMNLAAVFHGRLTGAEIAELSEEALHIAKHYMVMNTSNFEESVAGLFLVYALLNLQPYPGFAPLRVVQDDVPAIQRIELVARRDKRYDTLYILGAVLIQGPCHYHVAERERGMEYPLRKYLEGYTGGIDKLGVRPKGVFYRQNEELDIIRELNNIGRRYNDVKKAISGPSNLDRSLAYTNEKLPSELDTSLKQLITGIIHDERVRNDDDDDDDDDDMEKKGRESKHADSALSIKERAMKTSVRPMHYLSSIQERKTDPKRQPQKDTKSKRSPKNTNTKTSPGKVKNNSPTKASTSSPRKRKLPPKSEKAKTRSSPKKKKHKRQPKFKWESDSDDDEFDLTSSDDDIMLVNFKATTPKPETEQFKHEKSTIETIVDIETVPVEVEPVPVEESVTEVELALEVEPAPEVEPVSETIPTPEMCKELDIHINSLPVIIRTEHDGQLYEIEIIDNFEGNKDKVLPTSPPKKVKPETILNKLPDVSIKKIMAPSDSPNNNVEESDEMAQISKLSYKDLKFKKPERRQLKQPVLKSKFKRMGILPIANFEDPNKIL